MFLHGAPNGKIAMQPVMMLTKLMSLPSKPIVTVVVDESTAPSCAGLVPAVIVCGDVT